MVHFHGWKPPSSRTLLWQLKQVNTLAMYLSPLSSKPSILFSALWSWSWNCKQYHLRPCQLTSWEFLPIPGTRERLGGGRTRDFQFPIPVSITPPAVPGWLLSQLLCPLPAAATMCLLGCVTLLATQAWSPECLCCELSPARLPLTTGAAHPARPLPQLLSSSSPTPSLLFLQLLPAGDSGILLSLSDFQHVWSQCHAWYFLWLKHLWWLRLSDWILTDLAYNPQEETYTQIIKNICKSQ